MDDVKREVMDPNVLVQFWPGQRSAVVTEIAAHPRAQVLNFWLVGGDARELINTMRPAIERWGRAAGCTHFAGSGRPDLPSWGRVLKRHGYRPQCHVYSKDVANG